jgi:hypothetical protein
LSQGFLTKSLLLAEKPFCIQGVEVNLKKGLSFLLILLLVGTPLSLIRAADDWPKSGFDNCNTAYSPSQIERFKPWNRTLGDTVATPVIAGNMLYVATHNSSIGGKDFLHSLNAGTGDEK